ncbi:sarcosine oxidase delta subunit [Burkholderia pseudomallei 305]|nr:sarcosine oxidase delta subunit [Burkholderia pseudomallei 305]
MSAAHGPRYGSAAGTAGQPASTPRRVAWRSIGVGRCRMPRRDAPRCHAAQCGDQPRVSIQFRAQQAE